MNYYNENEPRMAAWLRELIKAGLMPAGVVDERSIVEVKAKELKGFTQCHFFAGIGGWPLALHIAGWPADRPIWTGSCPCQSFSTAGKQKGAADERHLWPAFFGLIQKCKPVSVIGEQVSSAIRFGWLDGVSADLESESYTVGAAVLGAHSVRAPHKRNRLYWVGDLANHSSNASRRKPKAIPSAKEACNTPWLVNGLEFIRPENGSNLAGVSDAQGVGYKGCSKRQHQEADAEQSRRRFDLYRFWNEYEVINFDDGSKRRSKPGVRCLAHGVFRRVAKLHGLGNAICPQTAAAFIIAWQEARKGQ